MVGIFALNAEQSYKNYTYPYELGDTKCIALDGYIATNDNGCSDGKFLVRIANKSTPSELKNVMIDTTMISGHGLNDANGTGPEGNYVSIDKLYLLTAHEV